MENALQCNYTAKLIAEALCIPYKARLNTEEENGV
jgi:hypothetical protein